LIAIALLHTPSAVTKTASDAEIVAGAPRQLLLAEFTGDTAGSAAFVEVPQLVAGDVAPQGEPQYEDFVFFDGTRARARNGETFADKVWPVKLPDTHPLMVLLFAYEDSDTNADARRGRYLAYNVFNPDRGGAKGEFKVNSINAASEGTHAYNISVSFRNKERVPSAQNPAPVGDGNPVYASKSPETGPVGTTVTVEGDNLHMVTGITVGGTLVDDAAFGAQNADYIVFDVPAGLAVTGTNPPHPVTLNYGDGLTVAAGTFTVTA
jgi:hypothetical protein